MKENRIEFPQKHKDCTVEDWNRVLWSDESPFELYPTPNRQNYRVWSKDSGSIEPYTMKKFLAKGYVWGMMSQQALSECMLYLRGKVKMESTIVRRFWLDLEKMRSIEEQKWIGFTAGHDFQDVRDNFYARRGSRSYG
ncbi:hypothetical protein LOD99_3858 [Oopsacas minuta]|uniref:Uncharacterized protein n=1 Tax=Oopsacas minuta TaxID=111878 RepID=A0AAV7JW21_9METZ|nr:hypothetical protein LOD99_3858 [Oopsacas minuta]